MRTALRRTMAGLGSLVFLCLVPGTVAGLIPWWLTDWQVRDGGPYPWPVRAAGWTLIAAGAAVLLHAFLRFVVEGLGTPAPVAPTEHLVIGGLYRHIRNPMYVAVVAAILGQELVLAQLPLLWYGICIALLQAAFVRLYEEPELSSRFGAEYDTYRRAVPAWWPRLRPWRGGTQSP